jgi:hypothetical protein
MVFKKAPRDDEDDGSAFKLVLVGVDWDVNVRGWGATEKAAALSPAESPSTARRAI